MSENKLIQNNPQLLDNQKTNSTIRADIVAAQKQVYSAVNSAMVTAYWNIGKQYMRPAVRTIVLRTVNSFCSFYLKS